MQKLDLINDEKRKEHPHDDGLLFESKDLGYTQFDGGTYCTMIHQQNTSMTGRL